MTAKKAQKWRDVLGITGALIMSAGYFADFLVIIGAIVLFSALIPDFLYNKCPHCKKHLGRNEGNYCHHCGAKIE